MGERSSATSTPLKIPFRAELLTILEVALSSVVEVARNEDAEQTSSD